MIEICLLDEDHGSYGYAPRFVLRRSLWAHGLS